MTITRRHLLQTTSASALLASLGQSVFAQSQAFPFETARLITGFAAVALNPDSAAPKDAKVLSKPFHLRDLVNEVKKLLAA